MMSEAKKNHIAHIEGILSRGEPALEVKGKVNPAWIIWYRAKHGVSGNVALNKGKRLIQEGLTPKVVQPPKEHKSRNPYGKLMLMFPEG
jgi:hypothetical protein